MSRNRTIYASQSVWCNGDLLYRVQSFGSTATFTSEDIFELGHLDIIDVVDDTPAVAITLNTNDFGDVATMAALAQVLPERRAMDASATVSNANLEVVTSLLASTGVYLHGVSVADFAVSCGALPGVTLWAPVQQECSVGSLANNIDQTLFMDKAFVNSLELGYSSGANATANYGLETDNKMWLLNDGRFVNSDSFVVDATAVTNNYVTLTLAASGSVAVLSSGIGFLRKDLAGAPSVTLYNATDKTMTNVAVTVGTTAAANSFVYHDTGSAHRLLFPLSVPVIATDRIVAIYAADAYGSGASDKYFALLKDLNRPDSVGAIRQGQVEVHIVADTDASFDLAWRLTSTTVSANLTREPLKELGHLSPYDRPLTLPVPLTVAVESTAGDLENWAKVANKIAAYKAGTIDDLDLADLMSSEDLKLVVKVYAQTDEEAGGTGSNRKISASSKMIGQHYWVDGTMATYSAGNQERALKTVVVEHLKITDEGMTVNIGSNATQTFSFRSTNDLYVIKGDISIGNITGGKKVRRKG
ncbi:hypothetical protein JZU46_00110 [bacterium]|nr:hypothetical protein [bacterium]